jgi:hypothetical protein
LECATEESTSAPSEKSRGAAPIPPCAAPWVSGGVWLDAGFDLSGLKGHNTGVSCAWERGSDHSPRESTPSMEARSVIAGNLRKIGV